MGRDEDLLYPEQAEELLYLEQAVEIVGGQTAMADACSDSKVTVKQGHVWSWLNRSKRAPPEYVLKIERATCGRVTRYQLRPDVFGEAPDVSASVDDSSPTIPCR